MDPAAAIELKILGYQKPMNDVIDRGDSPVQLFYNDATVFLTGGSGFIGKQLIEKLFRSCAIKKMYLLMRAKKGKTIHERLKYILSDPVYDLVRKKKPDFADRIVPVEGDVADIRLGLSDDNWNMLTKEVDTVFHVAATVRFNGPLREATITNVRGTREVIALARGCSKLKSLVHVSTAYSCATKARINKEVFEKFYSCPVRPEVLISLAEEMEDKRLTGITERLIDDWPNTYTFTKLVAEELIRTTAKDLPVCIIRPPIVIASYYEPTPGWLDIPAAVSGPSGLILAIIMGAMHVLRIKKSVRLAETPVDYVNNAIIGAGWDATERRKEGDTEIPIYAVTDKDHFIATRLIGDVLREGVTLSTDKAIYLCSVVECGGPLYWILAWLFHYIPAYLIDAGCAIIGKRPKEVKSFVGIYKKMDQLGLMYEYFTSNEWQFSNDNLVAMRNRMTDADKAIFNCDLGTVNFNEYIRMWGIGVRKYVIKDGLKNTKFGYKKQLIFRVINYIVLPSYAFLLWSVFRFGFTIVKFLLSI